MQDEIKWSFSDGIYIRPCPTCGRGITYKRKSDLNKGIRGNCKCKSCMVNSGKFLPGSVPVNKGKKNPYPWVSKIVGDKLRGTGSKRAYTKFRGKHMHRFLMEQHIGRRLRPKEIVHHIDGDKFNNDITNLQIVTRAEHARIHFGHNDK
jgi:hypothetical protein